MKIIGITGGIGAGKSTVLSILEQEYGAYCVEADKVAHKLMEPGEAVYQKIVEVFSTEVLDQQKQIHRGRMSVLVFQHPEKREQLNQIVHPAVKQYIRKDIERCRKEGTVAIYVLEAALLIEDGYKQICDEIWYVFAEEEQRIKRLMESRDYSREKCIQILNSQSTEEFYRENCNRIIQNHGDIENTKKQVEQFLMNK